MYFLCQQIMLASTCPLGSAHFWGSARLLGSTYRFLVSTRRLGSVCLLGSTPTHRFLVSTPRVLGSTCHFLGSTPTHRFPGSTPTHRFLGSTHCVARASPVEEKFAKSIKEMEEKIKDMEMKIHSVEKKKGMVCGMPHAKK